MASLFLCKIDLNLNKSISLVYLFCFSALYFESGCDIFRIANWSRTTS